MVRISKNLSIISYRRIFPASLCKTSGEIGGGRWWGRRFPHPHKTAPAPRGIVDMIGQTIRVQSNVKRKCQCKEENVCKWDRFIPESILDRTL